MDVQRLEAHRTLLVELDPDSGPGGLVLGKIRTGQEVASSRTGSLRSEYITNIRRENPETELFNLSREKRVQDAECFATSREECIILLRPRSCIYEHV